MWTNWSLISLLLWPSAVWWGPITDPRLFRSGYTLSVIVVISPLLLLGLAQLAYKNSDFWNCAAKKKEHLHPLDILLLVFVFPVDNAGKASGSPLTLDDLFDKNFQVHDPGAKWINGKEKCAIKERDFSQAAVPETLVLLLYSKKQPSMFSVF